MVLWEETEKCIAETSLFLSPEEGGKVILGPKEGSFIGKCKHPRFFWLELFSGPINNILFLISASETQSKARKSIYLEMEK